MTSNERKCQKIINTLMREVLNVFGQLYNTELTPADVRMCDSSDKTKYSRHVIIPGCHVADAAEARFFASQVKAALPAEIAQFIDDGVYKTTQCFRLPECHKVESTRVKKIMAKYGGDFDEMIITRVGDTPVLPRYAIAGIKAEHEVTVTRVDL
eukprot:TRINITY_DN2411_c0_g1_i2.p1 TRINITY_DN2411_c0_g1~~TRINITY_DN2411_c0_g1_i2.p1  ORF type:complete len:154 (+),score=13.36 TRINITY_DN2411_c0_g1_i2:1-462(+)